MLILLSDFGQKWLRYRNTQNSVDKSKYYLYLIVVNYISKTDYMSTIEQYITSGKVFSADLVPK